MARSCRTGICNRSRPRYYKEDCLRVFKMAVQRARSERGGVRVLVPYVEALGDTRTRLADFFTLPPDGLHTFAQQSLILIERH